MLLIGALQSACVHLLYRFLYNTVTSWLIPSSLALALFFSYYICCEPCKVVLRSLGRRNPFIITAGISRNWCVPKRIASRMLLFGLMTGEWRWSHVRMALDVQWLRSKDRHAVYYDERFLISGRQVHPWRLSFYRDRKPL